MSQIICAQKDSVFHLKTVLISDYQLKNHSNSLSKLKLNDTVIAKNQSSLTSLLNYNSTIYFKENGLGMVSSPSFRGTTAQQTAVIWNGININSQLNGQTDFNLIATRDFNSIEVRAGGGSSIYGSSAIGGSVHLNNDLFFENQFQNDFFVKYGSFETIDANYKMSFSDDEKTATISISRNSSQNDYPFINSDYKNDNGQFYNTSFSLSLGYKLNNSNLLKIYSQVFDAQRYLSNARGSVGNSKYQDFNTRNLVDWIYAKNKINSSLKLAFLSEKYKYFANFELPNFEDSRAETVIGKYDFGYQIHKKINLNLILDATKTKGNGENTGINERNVVSATLLSRYFVTKQLQFDFSLRKEITNIYESPILFSMGTHFDFSKFYTLKTNFSKNYRIPSFNDLYWSSLGNPNLKPESSLQGEIGHDFHFKNFSIQANTYYNKIQNLILWTPINGIWRPENLNNITTYGAEVLLNFRKKINNHAVNWNASYAYTISQNDETNLQLVYVPFHKFNSSLSYSFKKFNLDYQYLFNGYVFTLNDHNDFIKGYQVSNVGINYNFGKLNTYKIGFQTLNIFNENYESTENRPLPGTNFNINLTLKF